MNDTQWNPISASRYNTRLLKNDKLKKLLSYNLHKAKLWSYGMTHNLMSHDNTLEGFKCMTRARNVGFRSCFILLIYANFACPLEAM